MNIVTNVNDANNNGKIRLVIMIATMIFNKIMTMILITILIMVVTTITINDIK